MHTNIVFGSTNQSLCLELSEVMKKEFEMRIVGKYFILIIDYLYLFHYISIFYFSIY